METFEKVIVLKNKEMMWGSPTHSLPYYKDILKSQGALYLLKIHCIFSLNSFENDNNKKTKNWICVIQEQYHLFPMLHFYFKLCTVKRLLWMKWAFPITGVLLGLELSSFSSFKSYL